MTCCVNTERTVPLDSLLRHVATRVPALPYAVALDLVRQKYIEFARRSGLIVAYQELPIQREVKNYALEAPDGYEVFAVRGVGHPTGWMWHGPDKDYWFTSWGYRFWVRDNCEVIFDTAPSNDESERYVLLTVLPSPCADTIPASIATPYGQGIAAGAIADALDMPNKAWSNPNLASKFERTFYRTVAAAKNLATTNRGAVSPEFRPIRIL